jgi:pyruvate dehydrogenase E1 component
LSASLRSNLSGGDERIDSDPTETREWIEALEGVIRVVGPDRALFLLNELGEHIRREGLRSSVQAYSAYRNTIPLDRQGVYPGDLAIEERITSIIRWNALAMVARANQAYGELGGHIASYASAAEIFDVGFNHFFRAPDADSGEIWCSISLIQLPGSTHVPFSNFD